jgi:L-ascorbate metabolism protein UlaG (beta-lactamase superfamily)
MAIIHELYRPDIAMLPIGDRFTMGAKEATYACRLLKPEAVIPMHFGTFSMLTGTPEELGRELKAAGLNIELVTMKPGETVS